MILVLLGPPGVGKGTQATRISATFQIPAISTGAMFRSARARGDELGKLLGTFKIDQGEYVPDEIVERVVRARTEEPDCAGGFLLDGFPRTVPQANDLDAMLAGQRRKLDGVLDFDAPMGMLVRRFSGRRVCPKDGCTYHVETQPPRVPGLCDLCGTRLTCRPDDAPEVVVHRLEVYTEKTAPLLAHYKALGLLHSVDARPEPDQVFQQVSELIKTL